MPKAADRIISLTLLGCQHSQIVPRFWIVRTKRDRLFERMARIGKGFLSQVERSEIVMSFGIIGFGRDHLLKGFLRLFQVASLKECHAIGKVIAPKLTLVKRCGEGMSLAHAVFCSLR